MNSLDAFYEGGPKSFQEAFPPVCIPSHWDPTVMASHILPAPRPVHLPLDPRPASLICTSYYDTSAGDAPLPTVAPSDSFLPANAVGSVPFPPGGAARFGFPNTEYQSAIDKESDLFRMRELMTKCAERRYLGPPAPGQDTNAIPGAIGSTLSPYATIVSESTGCRSEDDAAAWARSARLFFNPTRYDRTTAVPASLHKAEGRYALAACGNRA
jgi:hypothetical protein